MTIYNAVASNKRKTYFILFIFIIFFITISYIFGRVWTGNGLEVAAVMFVASIVISLFSYFFSDQVVLSSSGAKQVTEEHSRQLYHALQNLTIATDLPMPKMYVIQDAAPNAFATGRDPKHASVAVTTGLLEKLTPAELEGVLAHELSHIKNYDVRLMGVVTIIVGTVALLADVFLRSQLFKSRDNNQGGAFFVFFAIFVAILAPIAATLLQLSLSRKREFLADADGALITRYPEGLARALEKIAQDRTPLKHASASTAHFYIEDPFRDQKGSWIANLFNTHPPLEERIKILREM